MSTVNPANNSDLPSEKSARKAKNSNKNKKRKDKLVDNPQNSLVKTVPDNWEISTLAPIPVLFFSKEEKTLATIPLELDFLDKLIPALNELVIVPEEVPAKWMIRYPEVEEETNPVLSFTRAGKILANLPLTEEILAELVPVLNGIYKRPVEEKQKVGNRLLNWIKKHKVWSVLITLVLAPVLFAFLLGLYNQIISNF